MSIWVPVAIHNERYDLCRSCDQSEIVEPDLKCKVCNCILLNMTRRKDQSCPLNKWVAYEEP